MTRSVAPGTDKMAGAQKRDCHTGKRTVPQRSSCRRANDNDTGCSVFSAERIGDPDAAIVLAVVEVLGQDLHAAHRAGCLDDRGVPV